MGRGFTPVAADTANIFVTVTESGEKDGQCCSDWHGADMAPQLPLARHLH